MKKSKEERRARRRAKKAERKKFKKLRKEKFNELVSAASKADFDFNPEDESLKFTDIFNQWWPVLKPALEYAEVIRITGPKADKILRTVIDLGQRISTGDASEEEQTRFLTYLDSIWDIVEKVLEILKTFTSEKTDEVIDQVIEIGEWITDNEEE